ncbi:MAG: gtf1 [Amnibacterium sp.]|nr:gtf1 [Amnibacterium sp.]
MLHVIESFGGGSANAMQEFVDAVPECSHHLLRAHREGEFHDEELSDRFASVASLPDGTAARIRAVRRRIADLRPDVVHAHSSLAGLYVRLAIRATARTRIVYSPHCFAFVRRDLPPLTRIAIAATEYALAANTTAIAACSRSERTLASRMPGGRRARFVPNTPRAVAPAGAPAHAAAVVSTGRLGPQKDPAAFADVVTAVRAAGPDVTAEWIGDGDPALRGLLERRGVSVSGWIPTTDVAERLAAASVYVHTAAWEGFPLAVLEAVAAGVPVVARGIPAFQGMPGEWLFDEPGAAADLIRAALQRPAENVGAWRKALAGDTAEAQRAALLRLYRVRPAA